MKRILVMLPYVPFPLRRGTFQRVFHLIEQLGKAFSVDLFCLSSEAEDAGQRDRFEGFCNRVAFEPFEHPPWASFWKERVWNPMPTTIRHWQSASVAEAFAAFVDGQDYDAVYWVDLVLWPYIKAQFMDHPALIMDRSRVDWLFQQEELATLDDSAWGRFMRRENLWKISRVEREALLRIHCEVVCGLEDKAFLDARLQMPEKVVVLPNGANLSFFDADAWPPNPTPKPTAVFCGALDYTPNVDGLAWYFEGIHDRILAKHPDYRLLLVGKNPTPAVAAYAKRAGVEFIGEVPDVRPYYQKAWFQIVPLRIGGGTRLKIAEGLAMKNPVVSTTLGAQGIDLVDGEHILLADSEVDFAAACGRMIYECAFREKLAAAGRQRIIDSYSWDALGAQLVDTMNRIIER